MSTPLKLLKYKYNFFAFTDTGGVKAFPIEGPFKRERARVEGMTDADRAYRKQWLKDQVSLLVIIDNEIMQMSLNKPT